jgi:hypothetical protein
VVELEQIEWRCAQYITEYASAISPVQPDSSQLSLSWTVTQLTAALFCKSTVSTKLKSTSTKPTARLHSRLHLQATCFSEKLWITYKTLSHQNQQNYDRRKEQQLMWHSCIRRLFNDAASTARNRLTECRMSWDDNECWVGNELKGCRGLFKGIISA